MVKEVERSWEDMLMCHMKKNNIIQESKRHYICQKLILVFAVVQMKQKQNNK